MRDHWSQDPLLRDIGKRRKPTMTTLMMDDSIERAPIRFPSMIPTTVQCDICNTFLRTDYSSTCFCGKVSVGKTPKHEYISENDFVPGVHFPAPVIKRRKPSVTTTKRSNVLLRLWRRLFRRRVMRQQLFSLLRLNAKYGRDAVLSVSGVTETMRGIEDGSVTATEYSGRLRSSNDVYQKDGDTVAPTYTGAMYIWEPVIKEYPCRHCGKVFRMAHYGENSYITEIKQLHASLRDAKAEAKHYQGVAQKKSDLNAAYKAEALILNRKLDGIRKAIYAG